MNFCKFNFDVFLVDDGSSDGTSEAIEVKFPKVNVIKGNGELYWNQGMRLAWKTASSTKKYDFYLWLNDDTIIDEDGISHLFECYYENMKIAKKDIIVIGTCRNDEGDVFSYGGRTENGAVIPNGEIQSCKYINGNFVLVSSKIVESIGVLSNDYTHAMGDYDYGIVALKNGFNLITTKKYVATCPTNLGIAAWCNPQVTFKKRWKNFNSPLGLNIEEYRVFVSKNWPNKSIQLIIKAYLKCILPRIYNIFKTRY